VCELLILNMSPEAVNVADSDGNTALHAGCSLEGIKKYVNCYFSTSLESINITDKNGKHNFTCSCPWGS